eukprot:ANDGO_02193.mRNA.1 IQ calmodulin-binding motif protein
MRGASHHQYGHSLDSQDVLQTLVLLQRDLASLREAVPSSSQQSHQSLQGHHGSPGSGPSSNARLESLLEKVEERLKLRTELLLEESLRGPALPLPASSNTSLDPSANPKKSSGNQGQGHGQRERARKPPVRIAPLVDTTTILQSVSSPTSAGSGSTMKRPVGSRPAASGRVQKRVLSASLARPLPAALRYGTQSNAIGGGYELHRSDLGRGLLDVVQRGLVPRAADLTLALATAPVPMSDPRDRSVAYPLADLGAYGMTGGVHMDLSQPYNAHSHASGALGATGSMEDATTKGSKSAVRVVNMLDDERIALPFQDPQQARPESRNTNGGNDKEQNNEKGRGKEASMAATTTITTTSNNNFQSALDSFSLHRFLVRKGRVIAESPEFASYKRTFSSIWPRVQVWISVLEQFFSDYGILLVEIDGHALSRIAVDDLAPVASSSLFTPVPKRQFIGVLMQIVVNRSALEADLRNPAKRFKFTASAAIRLQSWLRGVRTRLRVRPLLQKLRAVLKIQREWRMFVAWMQTSDYVRRREEDTMLEWTELQVHFLESMICRTAATIDRRAMRVVVPVVPAYPSNIIERARVYHEKFVVESDAHANANAHGDGLSQKTVSGMLEASSSANAVVRSERTERLAMVAQAEKMALLECIAILARNPRMDVVLVMSTPLEAAPVLEYYSQVFGIANLDKRFHLVVSELLPSSKNSAAPDDHTLKGARRRQAQRLEKIATREDFVSRGTAFLLSLSEKALRRISTLRAAFSTAFLSPSYPIPIFTSAAAGVSSNGKRQFGMAKLKRQEGKRRDPSVLDADAPLQRVARKTALPLYSPDASLLSLYSSRSGAKRLLSLADVNLPLGAYDLYTSETLVRALARVMIQQPEIEVWMVKLDPSPCSIYTIPKVEVAASPLSACMVICAHRFQSVVAVLTEDGSYFRDDKSPDQQVEDEVKERISEVAVVSDSVLPFPSQGKERFEAFMELLEVHGAVLEAFPRDALLGIIAGHVFLPPAQQPSKPSATATATPTPSHFGAQGQPTEPVFLGASLIVPSFSFPGASPIPGTHTFPSFHGIEKSTHSASFSSADEELKAVGDSLANSHALLAVSPQSVVPAFAIREACLAVARVVQSKRLFAERLTVHFLPFPDSDNRLRMWAVDVCLVPTAASVSLDLATAATHSTADPFSGEYIVQKVPSHHLSSSTTTGNGAANGVPDTARSTSSSMSSISLSSSLAMSSTAAATSRDASVALPGERRSFVSLFPISHAGFSRLPQDSLVSMLRDHAVSFSPDTRSGVLLTMPDALWRGSFGISFIENSENPKSAFSVIFRVVQWVSSQVLGPTGSSGFTDDDRRLRIFAEWLKKLTNL